MNFVVVCGLPGVGKTTVSGEITDHLGGTRFRTDVIRKELIDDPDYTPEEEETVYGELFDRARSTLRSGRPAVLDGTFQHQRHRRRAREIGADLDAEFSLVRVRCDYDVVVDRIRARTDDHSDADVEVHDLYRETFDPVEMDHVVVDNSGDLSETLDRVGDVFGREATRQADA